jgi:hypothetical protein
MRGMQWNVEFVKLVQIIFKNSVRAEKKTRQFTIARINRLTLFKDIIAVY